jgi:zinc finger CCHC domain-containing protein 9
MIIGTASGTGADEDDFHTFKRTTIALDRAERREEATKKMLAVKKGVVSGVIVRSGNVPIPSAKKVVMFK